uniref:Uncharacterized protein n=1 Tax=Solibacter usitatus (strain Ellin6076) TaxID=234267 RepID=Q025K2_SOLUE
MLHPLLELSFFATLVAGLADPPWVVPGVCLTPQNTVCRTLRWEGSGWENTSWGFHAIHRWSGSATLAYRRDGAILERNSRRGWRNYVVLESDWDTAQIKFPAEQRTIQIDHKAREYYERAGVPGGSPVWNPDDADCTKSAWQLGLSDLKRYAGETIIAGIRSIQYTGMRSKSERASAWLAPSLGCIEMRVVTTDRNSFGLPTAHSSFEVVSARIGEPDATLFQVPSGSRGDR